MDLDVLLDDIRVDQEEDDEIWRVIDRNGDWLGTFYCEERAYHYRMFEINRRMNEIP